MDSEAMPSALELADAPLRAEAARRQDEYEIELAIRLDLERDLHPNKRLDELGREIFRLAIFRGDSPRSAVELAMKDPFARRRQIKADLEDRLAHELDWFAADHRLDRRERPIRTVETLVDAEDFIVSPRCCDDYRRLTPRVSHRSSSDRLRAEVRSRGRFVPRKSDYLRVLVPQRFVMHVKRSSDGLLEGERLTAAARRRVGGRRREHDRTNPADESAAGDRRGIRRTAERGAPAASNDGTNCQSSDLRL